MTFPWSIFCSMKITQDVREYAREHGLMPEQAIEHGLQEQAQAFAEANNY